MSEERASVTEASMTQGAKAGRILGSLKDALNAASRDDTQRGAKPAAEAPPTYAKDSKDNKNAPVTEAATPSIWQRMLWGTKLTVGVNDAFDRQPPSVLGAFNDNYDTSNYSIRNRYWYVSLSKKF